MRKHFPWIAAILVSAGLRAFLLAIDAVPFNSDEAVVALMARHINAGARPAFFYGQAYMGSLDAFLVAGAFRIFGEAIWVIRFVQTLLYGAFLYTAWVFGRRIFSDPRSADLAVLLMAIPPVVVTTYTTATLGGYGESLLFGNLVLIFGYDVLYTDQRRNPARWAALGLVGGLGFWTLGIAGVYLLPVGIAGLLRLRRDLWPFIALSAAAFFLGSLPWWLENLANDWAALEVLLGRSGLRLAPTTPWERLSGLLIVGLPALFGFREPWEGSYGPAWMMLLGTVLAVALTLYLLEVNRRRRRVLDPGGNLLLLLLGAVFFALFVGTNFGVDATGRYLLPLYLPVAFGFAALARLLMRQSKVLGWGLVAAIVLLNGAGTWVAAAAPEGLTTQFDAITRFDNRHDAVLMAFLDEQGILRGYTNYWVSFRLAFVSDERQIFTARLPYKTDLSYTKNDNRYPPYAETVSASQEVAYITTQHPDLDAVLESEWARLGVTYRDVRIGPYHVYYDFSRLVRPDELVIPSTR